jgi:hypothetical protein
MYGSPGVRVAHFPGVFTTILDKKILYSWTNVSCILRSRTILELIASEDVSTLLSLRFIIQSFGYFNSIQFNSDISHTILDPRPPSCIFHISGVDWAYESVTSCIVDSAAIYIMVVKFRNTICPPPLQLSLSRRAAQFKRNKVPI